MQKELKIAIIGAGVSGICAGIQLQEQLGIHHYTIYEENSEVGGTWFVNTYPGCASDVPCHLYSFSFHPNPNWSSLYPPQPEVLEYFKSVSQKYDLYPKIKFQHQVRNCTWIEHESKWNLEIFNIREKKTIKQSFDILLFAVGGLRIPNKPPQFETFEGPIFHSAEWDSNVSLEGKKVAIIGTGASAVQIIPQIVDKVEKLMVYQRHAPWVLPRHQVKFPEWMKWTFASLPIIHWLFRILLFWIFELSANLYVTGSRLKGILENRGKQFIQKEFRGSKEVAPHLIPNYIIGCKRMTPSDEYYGSISKSNVVIHTSKIQTVASNSIICENGREEKIDVLILATGFRVMDFCLPMKILGVKGIDLVEKFTTEGHKMYLGIMASETPNSFMLLGPNSVVGHTSIIFSVECQVNWTMQVLKEMRNKNHTRVEVLEKAVESCMKKIQQGLKDTVWVQDCGNWYTDIHGNVVTFTPGNGLKLWMRLRKVDFDSLNLE